MYQYFFSEKKMSEAPKFAATKPIVVVLVVILVVIIIVVLAVCVGLFVEPKVVLNPTNALIKLTQKSLKQDFNNEANTTSKLNIFPTAKDLEDSFRIIRAEFCTANNIPQSSSLNGNHRIFSVASGLKHNILEQLNVAISEGVLKYPQTSSIISKNSKIVHCEFIVVQPSTEFVFPKSCSNSIMKYVLPIFTPLKTDVLGSFILLNSTTYPLTEAQSLIFNSLSNFELVMKNQHLTQVAVILVIDFIATLKPKFFDKLNNKIVTKSMKIMNKKSTKKQISSKK